MKIEKINDRQIRCTLTREDLASRQIKLSDLAYGSEKTKQLFQEMMQQAASEYGFVAEDIPLMIEAVPLSTESIMLIITKVDSPDELDTRFSNFANQPESGGDAAVQQENPFAGDRMSEIIELFENVLKERQARAQESAAGQEQKSGSEETQKEQVKMFGFYDLDTAFELSRQLKGFYKGDNALYKETSDNSYHLVIRQGSHSLSEFYKVYNTIAEYTEPENYTAGSEAFFKEHCKVLLPHNALQELEKI